VNQGFGLSRSRFSPANTHNTYTYDVGFLPCHSKVYPDSKIDRQIKAQWPEKPRKGGGIWLDAD